MALLRTVLQGVELDYPADRDRAAAPRTLRRAVLLLTAVAVGLVVALGVVQHRRDAASDDLERSALQARVEAQTDRLAALQADVTAAQQRIAQTERRTLAQSVSGGVLADRAARLAAAAGLSPVAGPGVALVVDDAEPDPVSGRIPDGGRVLDQDLQLVTNALWEAGAEAIAINGHRLTATSAIRSAGDAILVHLRPLLPPYTVQAIGDPAHLQEGFEQSDGGAQLRSLGKEYGLRWHLDAAERLELPAGEQAP